MSKDELHPILAEGHAPDDLHMIPYVAGFNWSFGLQGRPSKVIIVISVSLSLDADGMIMGSLCNQDLGTISNRSIWVVWVPVIGVPLYDFNFQLFLSIFDQLDRRGRRQRERRGLVRMDTSRRKHGPGK